MIQDIFPYEYDISFGEYEPIGNDFLCLINKRSVLCKITEDDIIFPKIDDLSSTVNSTYLFSISLQRFFYLDDEKARNELMEKGYSYISIRVLLNHLPKWKAYGALMACQLGNWYQSNRYCGRCGKKLYKGHKERVLFCRECDNPPVYPRINPCIIAAITDNDRIVLTKYPKGNHFALVAGFCEAGETIEQCLKREIKEEVGLNVKNLKYYKSQPWPLSDSLLFGFFCELDGDDTITRQEDELAAALWMKREQMEERGLDNSLTSEMMEAFRRGEY